MRIVLRNKLMSVAFMIPRSHGSIEEVFKMFSYVDKSIRRKLENDQRLMTLDVQGESVAESGNAPHISLLGPIPMPRMLKGEERLLYWYAFVRRIELGRVLEVANSVSHDGEEAFRLLLQSRMSVNSVLATPGFRESKTPLVRLHSCCMTGDVFGSMRCECGPQLEMAFERIFAEGEGAVVYMSSHEGRGIGLWAKAITYLLQDDGQDTYEANTSLGLPEDSRDFADAGVVLQYLLGGEPIRLLSNNPLKREHLEASGQTVSELVLHLVGVGQHNLRYMRAKRGKGHRLPDL